MQHRQQIRQQLGVVEERLEQLGALACSPQGAAYGAEALLQSALDSMRDLSQLVQEQQLFKSVPAREFLSRVCGLLVQDASAQGCQIALAWHGEGDISLEMAELVTGAVLAGLRASLRSHRGLNHAQRAMRHLFPTGSIYVEVRATPSEVQFRLIDDGQGFGHGAGAETGFGRLRAQVAAGGGWFGCSSFASYGGMIEFKMPLSRSRTDSLLVRAGAFELLIPSSCVTETCRDPARVPAEAVVFRPHERRGLARAGRGSSVWLRIGVADLQFWIGCDAVGGARKARPVPAAALVEEGAWLTSLGVFHEGGEGRALPLLDGAALARFFGAYGGDA